MIQHTPLTDERKVNHTIYTQSHNLSYLDILNGISRLTYRNLNIIDLSINQFLYVSDNCYSVAGLASDDIMNKGENFFQEYVPSDDLDYIRTARQAARAFYSLPEVDPTDYILTFDFHIENKRDNLISLVHHQFTPIQISEDKSIRLLLCMTSLSPYSKQACIEMVHKNNGRYWIYNIENDEWVLQPLIALKSTEKEVLRLSAQGLTISQIAKEMNKSFDTIKFYRKSIFKKLGVESITQALSLVISKRLL